MGNVSTYLDLRENQEQKKDSLGLMVEGEPERQGSVRRHHYGTRPSRRTN